MSSTSLVPDQELLLIVGMHPGAAQIGLGVSVLPLGCARKLKTFAAPGTLIPAIGYNSVPLVVFGPGWIAPMVGFCGSLGVPGAPVKPTSLSLTTPPSMS